MRKVINEVLKVVNGLLKEEYELKFCKEDDWFVFYIPDGLQYHLKTYYKRELIERESEPVGFLIDKIIIAIKNVKSDYVLDTDKWKF